jgi:hypothetical protein
VPSISVDDRDLVARGAGLGAGAARLGAFCRKLCYGRSVRQFTLKIEQEPEGNQSTDRPIESQDLTENALGKRPPKTAAQTAAHVVSLESVRL